MAIRIPTVHSSMKMYYVLQQYHGLQNIHSQGNDWPEGQDTAKYASSTVKNKSLAGITNFINSFKILLNTNIPAPKSVKIQAMRTLFLQLSRKSLSTLSISHQYMKQMSSLPQRHRLFRANWGSRYFSKHLPVTHTWLCRRWWSDAYHYLTY